MSSKYCLAVDPEDFLQFFNKSFIVLCFIFKSVLLLELIFI